MNVYISPIAKLPISWAKDCKKHFCYNSRDHCTWVRQDSLHCCIVICGRLTLSNGHLSAGEIYCTTSILNPLTTDHNQQTRVWSIVSQDTDKILTLSGCSLKLTTQQWVYKSLWLKTVMVVGITRTVFTAVLLFAWAWQTGNEAMNGHTVSQCTHISKEPSSSIYNDRH